MSVRTESFGHESRRIPFVTMITAALALAIGIGLGAIVVDDDAGGSAPRPATVQTRPVDDTPDPATERFLHRRETLGARDPGRWVKEPVVVAEAGTRVRL